MSKLGSKHKTYKIDPRRNAYISYFSDPTSPTFGKSQASALRAGYSKSYARSMVNITRSQGRVPLIQRFDKSELVDQARKNLEEFVKMDCRVQAMSGFGPIKDQETGEYVTKISAELMKIKQNSTHFIAERLDPENFSNKLEVKSQSMVAVVGAEDIANMSKEELARKLQERLLASL